MTLDHVSGADGGRVVPDLALAVPLPTDGGRSYAFALRPGIRYSTGVRVKPSDVKRSLERLFEIGSSGATYYRLIVGAVRCERAPARCDLSRGIVTNDRARTVTFHLTRPDPDFVNKLTLTYADVLPDSTPGREARRNPTDIPTRSPCGSACPDRSRARR